MIDQQQQNDQIDANSQHDKPGRPITPTDISKRIERHFDDQLIQQRGWAKTDPQMAQLLKSHLDGTRIKVLDDAIELLSEVKEQQRWLQPLGREEVIRLAAQHGVTSDEIHEDIRLQIEQFVADEGKTKDEIGEQIKRTGQSLASTLKNMVAEGRLVTKSGHYQLGPDAKVKPTTAPADEPEEPVAAAAAATESNT